MTWGSDRQLWKKHTGPSGEKQLWVGGYIDEQIAGAFRRYIKAEGLINTRAIERAVTNYLSEFAPEYLEEGT